jgi:hypothetical protein
MRLLLLCLSMLLAAPACAQTQTTHRFERFGFELSVPSDWALETDGEVELRDDGVPTRRPITIIRALGEASNGSDNERPFISCHTTVMRTDAQWAMERMLMQYSISERDAEFSEFELYSGNGIEGYRFSLLKPEQDLRVDYVGFDGNGKVVICSWGYRPEFEAVMATSQRSLYSIEDEGS